MSSSPWRRSPRLLKERESRALLHCDAVQGFLKVPCDPAGWGVDLMSLSAHKIGGPKGIGALYVASGRCGTCGPCCPAAARSRGLRSGTEATAQIAGFAKAVALRQEGLEEKLRPHGAHARPTAVERLLTIPGVVPVGGGDGPPHSGGVPAGLSQCQRRQRSGQSGHLHVRRLRLSPGQGQPCGYAALGLDKRTAAGVLRLSFGPETTEERHRRPVRGAAAPQKYEIFHAVRDTMLQCLKREPGFYRYLWGLTGPIALQNLITFTLGLMDTLMVSWLGNTQMAAVTTANVPVFLLISIVFGVQSGLSILVSQYWGKRDMEHISRAIGVAAMLGTGLTVVLAAVLYLWPVEIMDLLSNNHELSVLGAPYLKLIGISYVFNMLSSLYVSARRSAEDAGFGMKLFAMSTVLNTGLNYLLIFGKMRPACAGHSGCRRGYPAAPASTEFAVCSFCAVRRTGSCPSSGGPSSAPAGKCSGAFVKYYLPRGPQ